MIQFSFKEFNFSSVNSLLGLGHWEFDRPSSTFFLNRQSCELFGIDHTNPEMLGKSLEKLLGDRQCRSMEEFWSIPSTVKASFKLNFVSSNHTSRFLTMVGLPTADKIQGVLWDSTLENQKVDLAIEGSGFGVWEFHPQIGKLVWDNRMFSIYGHSQETFHGQPEEWTRCIHAEDAKIVEEKFGQLLNGGRVGIFEFRIIRFSDKVIRYIEANGISQLDAHGNVNLVVGMNRDVTAHKLEVERARAQESMLAKSSKMAELGAMAASIAHEINNPLTILIGKVEILQKKVVQAEAPTTIVDQELQKILNVSRRISETIKGLRNYSSGSEQDAKERAKVSDILEDTFALCREKFKAKGVTLEVNHEEIDGLSILCRPHQISQVILNLLNNAFDAVENATQKVVTVACSRAENTLKISVRDSGEGLTNEVKGKAFDPFFTTKKAKKGTGLGLSISKNIAEGHGGKLICEEAEAGAQFSLELPILGGCDSLVAFPSAGGAKTSSFSEHLKGKKILLVDDEVQILEILKEEFQDCGSLVTAVTSSEAALDQLSKNSFDIMITDYAMPGGDGLDLVERLNALSLDRRPMVFLCTAFNICSAEMASNLRIEKIFSKPFNFASIADEIERSLKK